MVTILIGFFGVAGVLLRYSIGQLYRPAHPLFNSTLTVNIAGCFVIGVCLHFLKSENSHKVIISSIAVGFCGGLTTFSSLILDLYKFIDTNQYLMGIYYTLISFVGGFLFFYLGHKIVS